MNAEREKQIRKWQGEYPLGSVADCLVEIDSLREKLKLAENTITQLKIIQSQNEANNCKFNLRGR